MPPTRITTNTKHPPISIGREKGDPISMAPFIRVWNWKTKSCLGKNDFVNDINRCHDNVQKKKRTSFRNWSWKLVVVVVVFVVVWLFTWHLCRRLQEGPKNEGSWERNVLSKKKFKELLKISSGPQFFFYKIVEQYFESHLNRIAYYKFIQTKINTFTRRKNWFHSLPSKEWLWHCS